MTDDDWTERLWKWAEENGIDNNVLPRNKKRLTKLTTLDLSRYKLIELPKEIANLTNLTSLSVYDKYTKGGLEGYDDIFEIRNLSDFTRFYIESGVMLHKLPKEITNLTNLTTVYLYGKKNKVLKKITKDDLCMIAKINKNPRYFFEVLSKHKDQDVRSAVAGNYNTPAEVLKELANDKAKDVRRSVANNGKVINTEVAIARKTNNPEILESLAKDESEWVRQSVAFNSATSSAVLKDLANDAETLVRSMIPQNPNTPEDALLLLATDKEELVRVRVAQNINISLKVTKLLAQDKSPEVRHWAIEDRKFSNRTKEFLRSLKPKEEKSSNEDSAEHLRWSKIDSIWVNRRTQSKVKELDSSDDAKNEVEKLIKQKTKKGYVKAKQGKQKTKKGYVKADPTKEVKDMIKASDVNYYELIDDKSSKFWEIEQKGSAVHLRWGKIGTKGQSKVKEIKFYQSAKLEVEKLIKQKTKKGYVKAKQGKQKTKKGYVKADPTKEVKDKIKASIVNLRKKLSRYKTYCKNNEIEIADEVKKNIESVELLCKVADKASLNSELYQGYKKNYDYFTKELINTLDSANIAWKPITERCGHIDDVKRDGDMIGCFPWTSESYPWPNKAAPGTQVDLRRMSQLSGENLGDGLLQVWFDAEGEPYDPTVIRVIPRDIVENESPDDRFVDFIPSNYLSLSLGCGEDIDFPGWIITDFEMIGIQAELVEEDLLWFAGMDEVDTPWGPIYNLLEDLHVKETSFFGVPYPLQNLWSEFYEEGQRNLLSLSSKEYFCIGCEDTGQLMYKKEEDGEIWFSYYWSHL